LIDLAHNMRMNVVAEVENFEQVVHLSEFGIRSAQGYVVAPALTGPAFLQLLEAIDRLPVGAEEEKVASAARRYIPVRRKSLAA
jgi:predicted signal transduction protein with EAL and GGDEF domain